MLPEPRWYGWGDAGKTFPLDSRPGAWPFLRSQLGLDGTESFTALGFDSIQLRESRLSSSLMRDLSGIVGSDGARTDKRSRVLHAYGRSYRDLVRLRCGDIANPPDVVVYPHDEEQVRQVVQFCVSQDFALIPFGGGSSVVGGVEPRDERISISLDLCNLNRLLGLDEVSHLATFQAGILGPDVEKSLNRCGFTLGHFPQSFEFSTLGGWIATRGAGVASTGYGKIEDMTVSVRVATPRGMLETRLVPASAAGPSLLELVLGSEGTLGVITGATMRVRRLPKMKEYRALLFKDFSRGIAAMRQMIQNDMVPTTVRLSEEEETRVFFALREPAQGWRGFWEGAALKLLGRTGYSFQHGALMVLGFEGDKHVVRRQGWGAITTCEALGAFDLGHGVARTWLRDRYETPYLRDVLMDRGILVDTLETATTWDNLERLHARLADTISHVTAETGSRACVMTHVSHCYRDGASLYVSWLARMAQGNEIGQWQAIKRAATDCIVANGGTLSHHHGIGYEHANWMEQEVGTRGLEALRAAKAALDPGNIMNPGKIFGV